MRPAMSSPSSADGRSPRGASRPNEPKLPMSMTTLSAAAPPDPETLDPEERLDRAQLEALQLERLQWTVRHAYENVPLYTHKLDDAGVSPGDIRSLDDVR